MDPLSFRSAREDTKGTTRTGMVDARFEPLAKLHHVIHYFFQSGLPRRQQGGCVPKAESQRRRRGRGRIRFVVLLPGRLRDRWRLPRRPEVLLRRSLRDGLRGPGARPRVRYSGLRRRQLRVLRARSPEASADGPERTENNGEGERKSVLKRIKEFNTDNNRFLSG